ncbi:MAG TPA: hypothetical protein VES38_02180 [Methylotenera sp.]|nr:hypothetical protein [Methylotenera sp.]
MNAWKQKLLWTWLFSIVFALIFMTIFVQGVLRDRRIGEPVLRIDFSSTSDWVSTPFRVWGPGTHTLFVSSVNHDPKFVGAELAADFEVSIADSNGARFFHQVYAPGSTGHVLPSNYGDSKLGSFKLDDWPLRSWTLRARVLKPDPRFKTAQTQIKFWKDRYDPGMGGLMNYVMIIPALVFLVLSFLASLALARKGFRTPMFVTVVCGVPFLVVFVA